MCRDFHNPTRERGIAIADGTWNMPTTIKHSSESRVSLLQMNTLIDCLDCQRHDDGSCRVRTLNQLNFRQWLSRLRLDKQVTHLTSL